MATVSDVAKLGEVAGGGTAGAVVAKGGIFGALKLWQHLGRDELSKEEKMQMEHIQSCFKATITDHIVDDPPEFELNNGKPLLSMTARRFETRYWFDMIKRNEHTTGNAILTQECKDLISIICTYQSKRSYGKVVGGKVNDPTNLMWEEFKNFLVVLAGVSNPTQKTLKSVNQRIWFCERVGDDKIFKSSLLRGDSSTNNAQIVLEQIRKEMNVRILPILDREFNTTCVRDKLQQLINKCKATIGELTRYLLLVYSNHNWNSEFNYGYLSNGEPPFHDVFVAKLLTALITSEQVQHGFDAVVPSCIQQGMGGTTALPLPPIPMQIQNTSTLSILAKDGGGGGSSVHHTGSTARDEVVLHGHINVGPSGYSANLFFDCNGFPRVDDSLLPSKQQKPNQTKENSKQVNNNNAPDGNGDDTTSTHSASTNTNIGSVFKHIGKHSGIHPSFHQDSCLAPFITAMGLTQEFGAFTGVWRTAKDLAGAGGDFMIYGPGLQHIYDLVPAFGNLVREMEECLRALNIFSDQQYLLSLKRNKNKLFRANTQNCRQHRFELHESLTECVEIADDILSTATKARDPAADTQQKWDTFINASEILLKRLQNIGVRDKVSLPQRDFVGKAIVEVRQLDNHDGDDGSSTSDEAEETRSNCNGRTRAISTKSNGEDECSDKPENQQKSKTCILM